MLPIFLLLFAATGASAVSVKVVDDLATYGRTVATMEDDFATRPMQSGNREWVQAKLRHMVDVDQYMRNFGMQMPFRHHYTKEELDEFTRLFGWRWLRVDAANTADLKDLLKGHRWITISEFGASANHDAWLLVQHADRDHAFQKEIVGVLKGLSATKDTDPRDLAYLEDRVDVADKMPQTFGTQGRCTGPGTWEPESNPGSGCCGCSTSEHRITFDVCVRSRVQDDLSWSRLGIPSFSPNSVHALSASRRERSLGTKTWSPPALPYPIFLERLAAWTASFLSEPSVPAGSVLVGCRPSNQDPRPPGNAVVAQIERIGQGDFEGQGRAS